MRKRHLLLFIVSSLLFINIGSGCAQKERAGDPYFVTGDAEQRQVFLDLFALLEAAEGEERFAVVREIAHQYTRLGEYGKLINFLSRRAAWEDAYTTYYLLMTAFAYTRLDAGPVAALYFDLIVKNYPDLTVEGESAHLTCLSHLINLTDNPAQRVEYYEELIARFPDRVDLGVAYFKLGQDYERVGEWNGAIQAYTRYRPYYGTVIPGFSDADNYAKQLVDFNNSPKDWTFESLSSLLSAVRFALDTGNSRLLRQYQAKVNFFARSWEQMDTDNAGMAEFNLADFMGGKKIPYAAALDAGSNANEAYLRTWGWQYIPTWYLYFRKINFPPDPDIHGRWEWAGIYYGEKF